MPGCLRPRTFWKGNNFIYFVIYLFLRVLTTRLVNPSRVQGDFSIPFPRSGFRHIWKITLNPDPEKGDHFSHPEPCREKGGHFSDPVPWQGEGWSFFRPWTLTGRRVIIFSTLNPDRGKGDFFLTLNPDWGKGDYFKLFHIKGRLVKTNFCSGMAINNAF